MTSSSTGRTCLRSSLTITAATPRPPSRRRDSSSSRLSLPSDLDAWCGEEKQLPVPFGDEASTMDAILAAQRAGIPLPKNIPSALTGGTIKHLGGRKIRSIISEDWDHDLELPDSTQDLKITTKTRYDFPETLRHVSIASTQASPTKPVATHPGIHHCPSHQSPQQPPPASILERYIETEDDDPFGNGCDTIKVSKRRPSHMLVPSLIPPSPHNEAQAGLHGAEEKDLEANLELPQDGKLRLSSSREIPKTPSTTEDLDWGEDSLGTRYGGTRRDGRSNRSSSASAFSPSASSSFTMESEDETFDGLVLPTGPVNFRERLHQRRQGTVSQDRISEEPEPYPTRTAPPAEADRQDFLDGLEIDDGKVFDSGKLTLHRNIKRENLPPSPARPKTAVSLTFNRPSAQTRIPRLNHERTQSTSLEPVYEADNPTATTQRSRRSLSRIGHSSHSSLTSVATPTTTSPGRSVPPSTPRRREAGARSSLAAAKIDSAAAMSTTSTQLLRQKRSLPAVRAVAMAAKLPTTRPDRPPSRTDTNRPQAGQRSKTPVDRQRAAIADPSASQTRKSQLPFLPAGASQAQSQHVSSKSFRPFRRHDSDNAIDIRPFSRSISRSALRSPSPQRFRLAADTWERLSKPKHKRQYGDGHELDAFDDLPTSRENESRLKHPVVSGPKMIARHKSAPTAHTDRTATPGLSLSLSPGKSHQLPHFARDTAASRIARESNRTQRIPATAAFIPSPVLKELSNASPGSMVSQTQPAVAFANPRKHARRPQQLKPHLIANLNTARESKVVGSMFYNAETYRWEGNENALCLFDNPAMSTPSTTSFPQLLAREKEASTPRPALITNFSATKGVQVVGGMVFDPEQMCWLKMGPPAKPKLGASEPKDGFGALVEEDEDVFKDIPDLEDRSTAEEHVDGGPNDIKDWLVGEEFDVGPEFIKRQREEEERWRRKCEKWMLCGLRDRESWRWTIRDLVLQFDELPM